MSIEGQGHFLTLAQGRVHTKFQTGFSQKLLQKNGKILSTFDFNEFKTKEDRTKYSLGTDFWVCTLSKIFISLIKGRPYISNVLFKFQLLKRNC